MQGGKGNCAWCLARVNGGGKEDGNDRGLWGREGRRE